MVYHGATSVQCLPYFTTEPHQFNISKFYHTTTSIQRLPYFSMEPYQFIVCHILPLSHINSMFAKFYHAATSILCLPYSSKQTIHDHILQSMHWMHDTDINKSRFWYVFSSLIFYSFPQ